MLLIVALSGVLMAQAAAPPAAEAANTVAEVSAGKPVETRKPKKICVDMAPIGSNIPHRVCRTAEQAEADAKKARDTTGVLTDRAAFCGGRNC